MQTPKGRTVEVIEGDPTGIFDRATQITDLAEDMLDAAGTLKRIGDGSLEGEGYAMDKIREVVDDSHKDLKEAGQRYQPAGPVLRDYADALQTAQRRMTTLVTDCATSQRALTDAEDAAADAAAAEGRHDRNNRSPEPDEAQSVAREGERLERAASLAADALRLARTAHEDNLDAYDTVYDTWERAYEQAVTKLSDANEIGKDSRWEDIAGVLAVIAEVLSWVGLAIAVIGLFVGGPFIALIAVCVAVISLALTIALMFDGRKGWGDLGWAIVGILPIGKLGMLFKKGSRLAFLKEIPKGLAKPFQQVKAMKGLQFAPRSGWRANWLPKFDTYSTGVKNVRFTGPFTLKGIGERFVGGTNRSFTVAFTEAVGGAPKQAMGTQLFSQLPTALQNLVGSKPTAFEQLFNVYKWADRGVSLSQGRPSGALSPAGFVNGLF